MKKILLIALTMFNVIAFQADDVSGGSIGGSLPLKDKSLYYDDRM